MRKLLLVVPVLAIAAFALTSREAPAHAVPEGVQLRAVPGLEPLAAPVADGKQYTVDVAPIDLKSGANGTATLTIKPAKGFKFNKEYPSKFTVATTTFARATKEKLTLKDGDVKIAGIDGVVTIPLAGVAAGAGAVQVTGNFSICNAEQCFMLRNEALSLQVTVK